jgi:hypothetical protein
MKFKVKVGCCDVLLYVLPMAADDPLLRQVLTLADWFVIEDAEGLWSVDPRDEHGIIRLCYKDDELVVRGRVYLRVVEGMSLALLDSAGFKALTFGRGCPLSEEQEDEVWKTDPAVALVQYGNGVGLAIPLHRFVADDEGIRGLTQAVTFEVDGHGITLRCHSDKSS